MGNGEDRQRCGSLFGCTRLLQLLWAAFGPQRFTWKLDLALHYGSSCKPRANADLPPKPQGRTPQTEAGKVIKSAAAQRGGDQAREKLFHSSPRVIWPSDYLNRALPMSSSAAGLGCGHLGSAAGSLAQRWDYTVEANTQCTLLLLLLLRVVKSSDAPDFPGWPARSQLHAMAHPEWQLAGPPGQP
jgi:hypothetical protein